MVSLEQVRLLESKVTKTIEYVRKVTEENSALRGKLDSCQKKIEELEVLIQRFRDDQSRIEDGILSALDRLNQFEDAVERKLSADSKLSEKTKAPGDNRNAAPKDTPQKKPPARPKSDGAPTVSGTDEEKHSDSGELDIF